MGDKRDDKTPRTDDAVSARSPGPARPEDAVSARAPGSARPAPEAAVPRYRAILRRYARSPLTAPRTACSLALAGLVLLMLVAASAPNVNTLLIRLPLSVLPAQPAWLTYPVMAAAVLCEGAGLAGLLVSRRRGWSPDPRLLFAAGAVFVLVFVCLTPVGSGDTASYAAYGRLAALGYDPYRVTPSQALQHTAYYALISPSWRDTPSVYGPVATWIQQAAAAIGGDRPWLTIWMLLDFNGVVFLGVGFYLLRRAEDPVRATLLWTANPLLLQVLVSGGHVDTLVAAGAVGALRLTRGRRRWRDLGAGVVLGIAIGTKIDAALVAAGIGWCLLLERQWRRLAVTGLAAAATLLALYAPYGTHALAPLSSASKLIALPSLWDLPWLAGRALFGSAATLTVIGLLWPVATICVYVLLRRKAGAGRDGPTFAVALITLAWMIAAPWAMPWYGAPAWSALAQGPGTRPGPVAAWLGGITLILALVHSSGGHPW